MNIGKSIRVACAKKEINQQELGVIAGISPTGVSHLVTGRTTCKQATLKALAEAFDMKVSEFIALGEA